MPTHHGAKAPLEEGYPNETMRLLSELGSCRDFSPRRVPPDVLEAVLAAGTHAPTGGNLQPYSVIRIEDEGTRRRLAELGEQGFIGEAPVLLLFCIDLHRLERWTRLEAAPFTAASSFRHFWVSFQDTVIFAQTVCTAADSMGLGSVYIGTVLEFFPELREMLQLPDGVFPVVLLCLGYPRAKPKPRRKLGVDVVVHDERYREMGDRELMDAFNEKYEGQEVQASEERLGTIFGVCSGVHGEGHARDCIERIRENGYINRAQWYFGLHYRADEMPRGNDDYLRLMKEFGFSWFERYEAAEG